MLRLPVSTRSSIAASTSAVCRFLTGLSSSGATPRSRAGRRGSDDGAEQRTTRTSGLLSPLSQSATSTGPPLLLHAGCSSVTRARGPLGRNTGEGTCRSPAKERQALLIAKARSVRQLERRPITCTPRLPRRLARPGSRAARTRGRAVERRRLAGLERGSPERSASKPDRYLAVAV
jgi:hypothetical protein